MSQIVELSEYSIQRFEYSSDGYLLSYPIGIYPLGVDISRGPNIQDYLMVKPNIYGPLTWAEVLKNNRWITLLYYVGPSISQISHTRDVKYVTSQSDKILRINSYSELEFYQDEKLSTQKRVRKQKRVNVRKSKRKMKKKHNLLYGKARDYKQSFDRYENIIFENLLYDEKLQKIEEWEWHTAVSHALPNWW